MANKVYFGKTALTGGAATALDYIDGSDDGDTDHHALTDGDIAIVNVSGVSYVYRLNATSGAAESSPNTISPDTNAGNKRWILQPAYIQPGAVVQVVNTQTGAYASGTTAMPIDDTIPQKTEGDEYMTLAITPESATNLLIIEVVFNCSTNTAAKVIGVALFQDDTAGGLAGVTDTTTAANNPLTVSFVYKMTAGTASATTFKVRAGSQDGTALYFNGSGGARIFGGVMASSITITEIKV